ncbi:pentatricopeptide repeat-containing protein At5g48910-like isoform X2 [Tripterygium wilfordii]|nr:pentatricopeptide repeat-containing protein At5g48910-like isoform X2 [Tripterygium wilfordii]
MLALDQSLMGPLKKPPCFQMIQRTVATSKEITLLSKNCKTVHQLKQLHAHLLETNQPRNLFAIAPLLNAAATSNNASFFSYARWVFGRLCHRNTFIYNSMVRGYMQMNLPTDAVFCYLDMLNCGFEANNYTFPPLIKACKILVSSASCVKNSIGHVVHGHAVKFGFGCDPFVLSALIELYSSVHEIETARKLFDSSFERDVVVWTAMVDGYGKVGNVESARKLFEKMPERNTISWSAMMAAYSRDSNFNEVLCLFRRMQEVGTRPNESALVSVLTACAHLGTVTQGWWVHSYAKCYRLVSNPILATALVDMYSKCGYVDSACSVFDGIYDKDAGAWNAMISGVAMNGDARKSLELFNQMIASGTQPTETTFVALLTACTHARMVKEGVKLFEEMGSVYGVEPKLEHYACVVDLLARAGLVEEAEKFIEEKIGGFEGGDANVWGALLGACRIYGNVEFGNRVWKKLADMGIADYGTHLLSYNIYREAGWDTEAKRVRKLISEVGMKKKPGCSVIEVNGAVEEFLAG